MRKYKLKCPKCSTALAPLPMRWSRRVEGYVSTYRWRTGGGDTLYRTCRKCKEQFGISVRADEEGTIVHWRFSEMHPPDRGDS